MRRVLVLAALVLASSCGAAPTSSSPIPSQPAGTLVSGAYLLTLSLSTGGSGISTCVSSSIGGAAPIIGVITPTPVQLDRAGNSITIRPDEPSATFRMDLQIAGANLSGTASGQYRSSATPVTVQGPFQRGQAIVTGIIGPSSAFGALNGSVTVEGLSCSNDGHSWWLAAR